VAAGAVPPLRPDDSIVATYHEHGQALARGVSARSIMAEMLGKVEGCSRGRGGSMHIFDAATRFYGGNAIVGGGIPLAVGIGLADKKRGYDSVTACFFGDGAVAEGEFHESMNLAELWKLPVLFCCENNRYGMGTAIERAESETDVTVKARSYRVPAEAVDGMDVLAVEDATRRALARIRAGEGPILLEYRTYRFRAHSMYDAELYRDRSEVDVWRKRDPLVTFPQLLRERGLLDDATMAELERSVQAEVDDAVAFAEDGHLEPVEDLTRYVYSEAS
jgi:pyruvate dehydrogenase E1 component alpha subunit